MSGFTLDEARALLGTRVRAMTKLTSDLRATPRASYIAVNETGTVVSASRQYDGSYALTVLWHRRQKRGYCGYYPKETRIEPAHFTSQVLLGEPLGDPA